MSVPVLVICCQTMMLAGWMVSTRIGAPRVPVPPGITLAWHVNGHGRGTPAVLRDRVYFLSRHHELLAIGRDDGQVGWVRNTGSVGPATGGARVVATPSGVVAGDDGLVAFGEEGEEQWRFDAPDGGGAGFYLGDVAGDVLVAGSATGWAYGVDTRTGVVRWSADVTHNREAPAFAPVVSELGILVPFGAAGQQPGGVALLDSETGVERWRAIFVNPLRPQVAISAGGGPLVVGQIVVVAGTDGRVHALALPTGKRLWSWGADESRGLGRLPADYRPLARAGPYVIAGSLSGGVTAYDLFTGRARWRATPHPSSIAFGIAAEERLVFAPYLAGPLVALDAATGRERWRSPREFGEFGWVPRPDVRYVFAASSAGYFAFRLPGRSGS